MKKDGFALAPSIHLYCLCIAATLFIWSRTHSHFQFNLNTADMDNLNHFRLDIYVMLLFFNISIQQN